MAHVTGILCQIITGDVDNAGTDGRVYLGLGGREFRLDSKADDYERGSWRVYVLGQGPVDPLPPPQTHVTDPVLNDPRKGFPLDTVNLTRSPVYVRFEPAGNSPNWNLAFAAALVYAPQFVVAYTPPADFDNLWLGDPAGKVLYLTDAYWREPRRVLELGVSRAAQAARDAVRQG
jgi:hypothetical protein